MGIMMKLVVTQQALKANKTQFNDFGKYYYRSCEDILEAVKPLLSANQMVLTLSDYMVEIGGRVYVEATATVTDAETGEEAHTTAYAREEETKKGMDASQVTGAASSYARKYALNGLFAIDDNKDSDATNDGGKDAAKNMTTAKTDATTNATTNVTTDNKFRCEKCGAVLKHYESNGKTYSIREHSELSKKKFGKVYCLDCINKIKGEQNA